MKRVLTIAEMAHRANHAGSARIWRHLVDERLDAKEELTKFLREKAMGHELRKQSQVLTEERRAALSAVARREAPSTTAPRVLLSVRAVLRAKEIAAARWGMV